MSGRPAWSLPGFRARQEAEAGPQEARVQLVRIRYGRDGYGFFTTSEGQVWRETVAAPARRHLEPDQTYEAVIRSTILGYRMNVDGIRWEYKVSRSTRTPHRDPRRRPQRAISARKAAAPIAPFKRCNAAILCRRHGHAQAWPLRRRTRRMRSTCLRVPA